MSINQFENPMTFVRAVKGAPASILWALLFTRQMMTALELQQWTGYKGDNITVAVRLLVDLGWVVARSPRGPWALAEGRQLPLMADSDLIGVGARVSSSSSSKVFPPSIEPQEEEEDESDLIGFVAENLAALDAAGIRDPKRSKLAHLEHVTPALISAHVKKAKEDHLPLGTAIHRIEYNWAVDMDVDQRKTVTIEGRRGKRETVVYAFDLDGEVSEFMGHPRGCKCFECRMIRSQHGDTRVVCATCKHFRCECEEESEDE